MHQSRQKINRSSHGGCVTYGNAPNARSYSPAVELKLVFKNRNDTTLLATLHTYILVDPVNVDVW